MNQEVTVNRILRDLKMAGLITTDEYGDIRSGEARFYLNALFVAGLEASIPRNQKQVVKVSKSGKVIGHPYASAAEAARKENVGVTGIYSAIEKQSLTKKGYYWQYLKNVG